MTMRTIALEEHFSTEAFTNAYGQTTQSELRPLLCDVGAGRIAAMDAAGIDVQVLSLAAPGVEQLKPDAAVATSREVNDGLAQAVRRHPKRLAGFATLPTPAPAAAADELERAVRDLGFKGAMINGHSRGRRLDDHFFWPILERAERLGVPLYLHPAMPPQAVIDSCYSGFAPEVTLGFAGWGWGWHIETAIHILRMILSGAFDRYPKLQLVIGHMGEALPFMIRRLDHLPQQVTKLDRPIAAYLRQNVRYTFSGFNWNATFLDLMLEVGVERIMFSADYPWGSMVEARRFLDQLPVSPSDRERVAHINAEELLGL